MGIEMAAERIAKPTIDELREDLLTQQFEMENYSNNGGVVPEELLRKFYSTYEKYLELRKGPDRNLEDPIASKLAATFARASRVVRGDHGNSHHEHWH